jgi:hypothetical protein
MKTFLKIVLTITFPIWAIPAGLILFIYLIWLGVSSAVDNFNEKIS